MQLNTARAYFTLVSRRKATLPAGGFTATQDKAARPEKKRRQCIRYIYVGGLIARELTVSTGSYLARQFLLLQPTAIYPGPRSGCSFVAEASYGPSSANAHSSHSANHRSNAAIRSLENDSPFLCPLTLPVPLAPRSPSHLAPEASSTMRSPLCRTDNIVTAL